MNKDLPMRVLAEDQPQFVKNSVLYKEFLAEREEILKHKWIESEKAGADIGSGFLALDPLVFQNLFALRQELLVKNGVLNELRLLFLRNSHRKVLIHKKGKWASGQSH